MRQTSAQLYSYRMDYSSIGFGRDLNSTAKSGIITGKEQADMVRNSTSWRPGTSGNPKGAPKRGWTWSDELQKALEKTSKSGVPLKTLVAESLVNQALNGNSQAIKIIFNRMDGLPIYQTPSVNNDPLVVVLDSSLRHQEES